MASTWSALILKTCCRYFPFEENLRFLWNFGFGGVWVVTKTNVKVLGEGLDNDFYLAGYTFTGKSGPRVEFKKHLFILGEVKGGYASLPSVLI